MVGLSLVGIVLGIGLFIFLSFKSFNTLLSTILASLVIILFSQMPLLDSINLVWMGAVGGFLQGFFLIFVFSSLFGQTLSDGKGSRAIAVFFAKIIRKQKKGQKLLALLFVPLMYSLLSYAGISGFVIVFTVLAMSRDLFQEFDVPWRLYCYGGSSSIGTIILGGSLQLTNIVLKDSLGTSLTAAMGLSIVGAIAFYAAIVILIVIDLRRAEKNNEGFMRTGEAFKNDKIGSDSNEELPHILLAITPIVVVIVLAIITGEVLISITVGILLNLILFRKYIPSTKETISNGVISGFVPVINVAATVGISAIIANSSGFGLVQSSISTLPPLIGGIVLIALISFLTASPTSALTTFAPPIANSIVSTGISVEVAHRIIGSSTFTCIGPHSPGLVNTTALAKITYKDAVTIYLKSSLIPGAFAIAVMLLAIKLGIFV